MVATLNRSHEQLVRVTGKGDTKQKAFASALSQIQKQVVDNEDAVTLQITPLAVLPVSLNVQSYRERFLFLFFPRIRTTYHVVMDVRVRINAIDLATVPFETTVTDVGLNPINSLKGGK